MAARFAVRLTITAVLGVVTFLAYYFVIAELVLHEPIAAGDISGNALGWWNWVVLWALFYVLGSQNWGLPQGPPEQSDTVADAPGTSSPYPQNGAPAAESAPDRLSDRV